MKHEKKKAGILQTAAILGMGAVCVIADKIGNGGKKK